MDEFIPKYKLIGDEIEALIDQLAREEQALPSERKLAEHFDVSRTTIKRALKSLAKKGKVSEIDGKGYIIPNKNVRVETSMHTRGLYADIVSRKKQITSRVLAQKIIPAAKEVSVPLEIPENDFVFYLLRLRSVDGKVYSLSESYIPLSRCNPDIVQENLTDKSLWGVLESFGITPHTTLQKVFAREASPEEKNYLQLKEPAVVMIVSNLACWQGKPIELSYVYSNAFATNLEYRFNGVEEEKG